MEGEACGKSEELLDVIIVGAGVSGLTAAYRMKSRDPAIKVAVLEGKDRVGGRTLTVPLTAKSGSDVWDLGGQWVDSYQVHIMHLLKELGLETYTQFSEGKKVQQLASDKVVTYTGDVPKLSWLTLIDLYRFMSSTNKHGKRLSTSNPYSHPKAAEWDSMTLADAMDNILYTKGARAMLTATMRALYACEPSQISYLYYLVSEQMGDGTDKSTGPGSGQEAKVKGGTQQISEILRDRIGKDSVYLNDAVVSIKQAEQFVEVHTKSGITRRAKYVILAVPPPVIEHINISPNLPPQRKDLIKNMVMGSIVKIIVTYEATFWRDAKYSGEAISDGGVTGSEGSAMKPLCGCMDATTPDGNPALVAFIGGQTAVDWAKESPEARKDLVIKHLCEFFGPKCSQYLDYAEQNWMQESYIQGGSSAFVQPGGMHGYNHARYQPEGRLHFAGTETATFWSGYINGAVQAGERAAAEVMKQLRPDLPPPHQTESRK